MRTFILLLCAGLSFLPGQVRVNNLTQDNSTMIQNGRILFGHQSVGENILQGIRENAARAGEAPPRRVHLPNEQPGSGAFLADVRLGTNGDPASKCEDFLKVAHTFPRGGLDVALMKFCYTDITAQTDVPAVFSLYRRAVDSLRAARPDVVIVHCTVPLTASTPTWKRFVKWILGRGEGSDQDNLKRAQYNDLLRETYKYEPIFDIASLESTLPDGSRSSFSSDGKKIYTLADQYTSDGGHLNEAGRSTVATAFVRVLGEALAKKKQLTNQF